MLGRPPYIAVADTKYVPGTDDPAQYAPPFRLVRLDAAFGSGWQTDAHFVCYHTTGTGQNEFPRLKKPILPKMRHYGADIVTQILAFDYDNPEHKPWAPELWELFWSRFETAKKVWPLADEWSCLYTTRAGARLVFLLDEAIPCDVAEAKHRWMTEQFINAGLAVDRLSDWTRFFRLPYVIRDDKATWLDGQTKMWTRWEKYIKAEGIPAATIEQASEYAQIREFREPKPYPEQANDLISTINHQSGRRGGSDWFHSAKKRLRGRECYACLFEHKPLAEKGERNATLHKYVGQAIAILYYTPGTTPQHIYGLFLDAVQQLQPDAGTRDWTDVLWDHVGRIWVLEEAKAKAQEDEQARNVQESADLIDKIIGGMRTWCTVPALYGDDASARAWVMERLIASCGGNFFVMKPNGFYDDVSCLQMELISRIRALGMDRLIEIRFPRQDGLGWTYVETKAIIDRHTTLVSAVQGKPQMENGGVVEHMDTAYASLTIESYRRNPNLEPTFNPLVDEWLKQLFGDRYNEGCEWIGHALAFEEGPICALSIKADQGIGKKLFAQGLAECLWRPRIATAEDLTGSYQYALLASPFIHIDEGWPQGFGKGKHPADAFRSLVSGQSFDVNRKFKAPIEVSNPVRFLFTANNFSVVQMLTAGRDLSPEDREALSIRLKHFDLSARAATWLRNQGGLSFTGRKGARWIKGDGGEPSDFLVAKHFMWLYATRKPPHPGSRFLVEGNASTELLFEMRTKTGSTPLVIEAIIKMLNMPNQSDGLAIYQNGLYVLTSAVLDYFRSQMINSGSKLTAQSIAEVFKGLILEPHPNAFILPTREHVGRRNWHQLDPHLLLKVARRDGWKCERLEELARRLYGDNAA